MWIREWISNQRREEILINFILRSGTWWKKSLTWMLFDDWQQMKTKEHFTNQTRNGWKMTFFRFKSFSFRYAWRGSGGRWKMFRRKISCSISLCDHGLAVKCFWCETFFQRWIAEVLRFISGIQRHDEMKRNFVNKRNRWVVES